MGSFVVLSMLGIFPVAGQNVYLITPPFFEHVSIKSKVSGKKATIRNVGFDSGYRNIYIQSATLDGKPYTRNWITHEFFVNGGVLELTLGPRESAWGTKTEDLPPSLSTSGWANSTLAELDWDVINQTTFTLLLLSFQYKSLNSYSHPRSNYTFITKVSVNGFT